MSLSLETLLSLGILEAVGDLMDTGSILVSKTLEYEHVHKEKEGDDVHRNLIYTISKVSIQ